jgi:BlaI family transcriptional regulator, penicillinase repressor
MPPKTKQPSDLELQLLSVLWEKGPSTVREILSSLPDGKTRAYTTVLTVMQNLDKKGLVNRTLRGTAHVYQPTETQRTTLRPLLQSLLKNVFQGKVSSVMQHLLEDPEVSDDELNEIRELIDQRKRTRKSNKQ